MNSSKARKIIDAHGHLYDHRQNWHEFLENVDAVFEALIGDYSALPRRYLLDQYLHRPICGLSRTFPTPYAAYEKMTEGLSLSEQDAVFRLNAADWFFSGSPLSKGNGVDAPL